MVCIFSLEVLNCFIACTFNNEINCGLLIECKANQFIVRNLKYHEYEAIYNPLYREMPLLLAQHTKDANYRSYPLPIIKNRHF